ncbi:FAD binding domain protein [Tothia fuscella]|uniref:FAD binding domain protein n=1 Tax=Tothia fuscella TaxID=1048955 RepID=A0A9P4NHG8_9PEZI|nr:FAD binding domain protein [Tothia fuscella]
MSQFDRTNKTNVAETRCLRIIIVGAGLSGIGAAISCALGGHSVTVLESAAQIAEIGAGLQITPNASRLLRHWGLSEAFWARGSVPKVLTVHRYSGAVLARQTEFDQKILSNYGAPFIDMHRADLQIAMVSRAHELGVKFHLGERVVSIDFEQPSITTKAGNRYSGDLIVAADGLWSRCREIYLGRSDPPLPTGDLAYRIVLTIDELKDEDLKQWVQNPEVHCWIGPGSHVVGYSLRASTTYNLVLLCPDNLPADVAKATGSIEEMKQLFIGWDPVLTRFLSHVKTIDKWKLTHMNEASNLVSIGDSCHPMLPYLAQGANSSLEDGAVLGGFLGNISSKSQLPNALRMYERLRKEGGEAIVRETFKQRHDFHMPDGPEQEARDELFMSRLGKEEQVAEPFPSRWTCPVVQPWLYGYDAVQEVENVVKSHRGFSVAGERL